MEENRRNFLKKSGLLASAAALTGLTANSKNMKEEKTVLKVRALGFQWETQDPFLFCVHHEDNYPEGNEEMGPKSSLEGRNLGSDFMLKDGWRMYHGKKVPGFPSHPHRGFETITVVRDGYIDHADSMGGAARYGHGDVQWMTAGKGIQHSEMFPLRNSNKKNRLELFQIWLNLPKKSKMVDPYFKMNWSEDVPVIKKEDENGNAYQVELLAGELWDKKADSATPESWAADKENEVLILAVKMDANAELELPAASKGINRTIYFFEGDSLQVNEEKVPNYYAADLKGDSEIKIKNGAEEGQFLLLQGKPINEPTVIHGPFVMNSQQEIRETIRDYQSTQFGGWPWNASDPVHDKTKYRFAKHPDGRLEEKKES
jgi:redox-sensitive bicupin YhaK (pirin superfamily)